MSLLTCSEIHSTKRFNKNKLMSYFKGITLKTHSIILYLMHTLKIDFFFPTKVLKVKRIKNSSTYTNMQYRLQINAHKGEVLLVLSLVKSNFKNLVVKNTGENQAIYDKLPN